VKFDATKEEVNALLALLDLAVKAGGLNVAMNALVWAQKIKMAQETKPKKDDADEHAS
jgi:hypothetical protein